MDIQLFAVVEGYTDRVIVEKLIFETGLSLAAASFGGHGKGFINKNLSKYNMAARSSFWLVLRDLDHDAECAPLLKKQLLPHPEDGMCFCIAVREIEAWLMADTETFSQFMSVPRTSIPNNPEWLDNPKATIVNLAFKSRDRGIKIDMTPESGSKRKEGPAYASRLAEFALKHWRPKEAAKKCESLKYCLDKLRALKNLE